MNSDFFFKSSIDPKNTSEDFRAFLGQLRILNKGIKVAEQIDLSGSFGQCMYE